MEFRIPIVNDLETQEEFHNFKLRVRTEYERLFPINKFLGWCTNVKRLEIGSGVEDPDWSTTKYIFTLEELRDLHQYLNQYELGLFVPIPVREESQFERLI